jgi:molecular chaperone DnaK
MNYINFAIDLGTTNSLIGKFTDGKVKLFKNPKGFKETLPSCVAFRRGKIFIGEKAREFKNSDPEHVFSSFKRKMGTDEKFHIKDTDSEIDAVELSTYILNELKTFANETIESVVITIPASFDTIQSNSTKEAGIKAGFKEVVLLQEPIAACLSVFNEYQTLQQKGKWLIYDLGGGTFDVAIVSADEDDLKVIDHLGNNFLGGLDFDELILKKVILSQLKNQGNFDKLIHKFENNPNDESIISAFNYLLFQAEQLKIELSSYSESSVDFVLNDDDDHEQDICITLDRSVFNEIIDGNLTYTINLIEELLETNKLKSADIQEIVLVGGSTYIPYVKEKIQGSLGIKVNDKIDPTNAICAGASYYAGNKLSKLDTKSISESKESNALKSEIQLTALYENQTKEDDTLLILKSNAKENQFYYRIVRKDLAFDSGKKILQTEEKIILPLKKSSLNVFHVEIYDLDGNLVDKEASIISINHGMYIIDGQPLPHDICIEIDDIYEKETKLELVFSKNSILPLSKTIYKTLSRNILESSSESLVINILEGDKFAKPSSNQVIGCISVSPKDIGQNLIKDSDVEIRLEVSESRDIKINVYISLIDYEVSDVFSPTKKSIFLPKLREEISLLNHHISKDLSNYLEDEKYESASELQKLKDEISYVVEAIGNEKSELGNDTKYHLEELKRQISVKYDKIVQKDKLFHIQQEYIESKKEFEYVMESNPDFPETLRQKYRDLIKGEQEAIYSNNVGFLRSMNKQMEDLMWQYNRNSIEFYIRVYTNYKFYDLGAFKDVKKVKKSFELGDKILERGNPSVQEIIPIIHVLYENLEEKYKIHFDKKDIDMKGTGLS